MSNIINVEEIKGFNGLIIRVHLIENILTDDTPEEPSRTYDVRTSFFDLAALEPNLVVVDMAAESYNVAWKKFVATHRAMTVFEEAEIQ